MWSRPTDGEGSEVKLAHVIAEGAIQLRQWTQPPSSTTLVSGEHGELSHVFEVTPRNRTLCGLSSQRIGEANNPGPASRRRRTQRLRALQRAMDSDSEFEAEYRKHPPHGSRALKPTQGSHPRALGRFVLPPTCVKTGSVGGSVSRRTPQSVDDRDPGSPTGGQVQQVQGLLDVWC